MTNQHNKSASNERIEFLEKKVAQIEKLCYRLFDKKKSKNTQKDAIIKKKLADLLRKNIHRSNSLVIKRIQKKS